MIKKGAFLPSAWPCFRSEEFDGNNNHRMPQGLHKTDQVTQQAWLKPPVATGDASAIAHGRGSQAHLGPSHVSFFVPGPTY